MVTLLVTSIPGVVVSVGFQLVGLTRISLGLRWSWPSPGMFEVVLMAIDLSRVEVVPFAVTEGGVLIAVVAL